MDGTSYIAYSYRLRSSGMVPIKPGRFLLQAFGGEKNKTVTWEATTTLPKSDEFIGATVGGPYMRASFNRLPYFTEDGEQIFQGSIVEPIEFIDESEIPGQGGW